MSLAFIRSPRAIGSILVTRSRMYDVATIAISDVPHVRAVLTAAARSRRAISYSELLDALGHRFSRPKMRAVCKTLDAIDEASRDAGEPELAVLVVRGVDGLPGQGWWPASVCGSSATSDLGPGPKRWPSSRSDRRLPSIFGRRV